MIVTFLISHVYLLAAHNKALYNMCPALIAEQFFDAKLIIYVARREKRETTAIFFLFS